MIPFDSTEAMRSGVYCSGTTGVGKSDVLMYVADQLMKEGIIVVVFDPTQDWQNRSSIPQYRSKDYGYIFHPELIIQESTIFDFSKLTPTQQQQAVEEFCKIIMLHQADIPESKRKKYFLIFEEAHTYFPEGCMRAKRYQNTIRMMTQGRNFGIRFACITQFASLIDKNAMRYMRQRYFGSTDEPNDFEYVLRFFPKNKRDEIAEEIVRLKAGQFIYKNGNHTELVKIEPYKCDIKPKLIVTSNPSPASPSTIIKPHKEGAGAKAIATLLMMFLWFIIIMYALSRR
jgi:hypothetical protein